MNLSEEQIKHILQSNQVEVGPDLQLENTIMNEVMTPNRYESLIQKSREYAKNSLWTSTIIATCLIVYLFYRLFSSPPLPIDGLGQMFPSLAVVMMLFILFQLLYFCTSLGAATGGNSLTPQ